MRGTNGDPLGEVEGRAAAQRYHAVTFVFLVQRHGGTNGTFIGIRRGLIEYGCRSRKHRLNAVQQARLANTLVRHDQRALNVQAGAFALQQFDAAVTELHLGHIVDECHMFRILQFSKIFRFADASAACMDRGFVVRNSMASASHFLA